MKLKIIILLSVTVLFARQSLFSQSVDRQIGNAMNNSDWFELYDVYNSTPKDSVHEFLEVYSRCLIGNRLNRPDISIPAFEELFNTKSSYLDLGNLVSSSIMYAMDLSRVGKNDRAAQMLNSVIDATKQHLDSASIFTLESEANKYAALSSYDTYGVKFNNHTMGTIPFNLVPIGPSENKSLLMHLEHSRINGIDTDITFDTGAGVNVICDSLAKAFNLIPLEAGQAVRGYGVQSARYAIAKEVVLGDITLTDVPFCIMNITSHNTEADQYFEALNVIIGSEVMLQLKDLTLDFSKKEIMVPANAPTHSDARPNLCFSSSMNLEASCEVLGEPMLLTIDSGNGQFGVLGPKFLEQNREYIATHASEDKLRMAGIGGVHETTCYTLADTPLALGGTNVTIPRIDIMTVDDGTTREGRLGLPTLMLFDKVRFNLVDFILTTE